LLIIPGPASTQLGRSIARSLDVKVLEVESKSFPDGESYVRLMGDVKGEHVAVVQSTCPPQDTHLMQLLMLVDAVSSMGAIEVTAVVPYLAYARQDRAFRPFEAVSIRTVLNLLGSLSVKRLVTVDIHTPDVFNFASFSCVNLSTTRILTEYFSRLNLGEAMAFAPDEKAVRMASEAAGILKGGYGWFKKERDRVTSEIKTTCAGREEVKGKTVILFDDIISSGGTTANAVRMLKELGAKRVFSACVHPLLVGSSYEKILGSGAESVVGTDSVPSKVSLVSVGPLIAEALR